MSTSLPGQDLYNGVGHVSELLADLITGLADPAALDDERVVTHLLSCEECRVALGVALAAEAARSDLSADTRHSLQEALTELDESMHEPTFSADEELFAAYAETLVSEGEAEAQARYPQVARHLARCAACQADMAELAAWLSGALSAAASEPSAAAADSQRIWETAASGMARLRAALTIIAGQATISVQSALPGLRAVELSPGVPVLSDVNATVGRQERLIFTMRTASPHAEDDQAGLDRWLRVILDVKALYDHTVEVTLTSEAIISATTPTNEIPGVPWPNIAWRIERREQDTLRPFHAGKTSQQGAAFFSFRAAGQYELSLDDGTATWVFPLDIRR